MRVVPALLLSALFGLASSACTPQDGEAAAAIANPTPSDRARLVIYRPAAPHLLGRLADHEVAIDGQPVCTLANDAFFVRDAATGTTTIAVGASQLAVAAVPGTTIFVRIAFNPRRATLAGWIPPVLGFEPDARTQDSGLFAIEPIEPASAARELAGFTRDPACG